MPMYWWANAYSVLLKEDGDKILQEDGSAFITEGSTVGASWRLTNDLSVWDGSWKNVLNCWIYDGSAWKVCYIDNAMSLDDFDILDAGGGTLVISWAYTGTRPQDWRIYLDASSNSGATYTNVADYDVTVSPQNYSGSASDWYRLRLVFATDTVYQATGSPKFLQPPYPV